MNVFLSSVIVAILIAGAANLVLTRVVQVSAESAFSAASARP